jgi:hypothetical protein
MGSMATESWRQMVSPPRVFPIQTWWRVVMTLPPLMMVGVGAVVTLQPVKPGEEQPPLWVFYVFLGAIAVGFVYFGLFYKAFVILDERGIVLKRMFGPVYIPWQDVTESDIKWVWSGRNRKRVLIIATAKRKYSVSSEFKIDAIQKMIAAVRTAQMGAEPKST